MNPYAPPGANVADAPRPGSALKAVTLGLAADIGGTLAAGVILALAYGIVLGASGATPEEITAATNAALTDSWVSYASTVIGLGFSLLGGYVCGRIARREEMKLGAIVAVLSAVLGVLMAGDAYQLGTLASLTLASIGAVMIGARLAQTRNRGTK